MSEEYEIPSSFLKRLILKDNSEEFHIIINVISKEATKIVDFKTTINKARVMSKKINETYDIDPTICAYEASIPSTLLPASSNLEEIIKNMLQLIQTSLTEKVKVNKEEKPLFYSLLYLLGNTEEAGDKIEISSSKEAVSLLNTRFHDKSIEYLSSHLKESIESGDLDGIEEEIYFEIIDSHFLKEQEEDDEEIFESMKKRDETKPVVMHFLLHIESGYSQSMAEYISENLDDEIFERERSPLARMIRQQLQDASSIEGSSASRRKRKNRNMKTVSCEYEGDELKGIISYLESTTSGDLDKSGILSLSGGGTISSSHPLTNIIKYDSSHINNWCHNNFGNTKPSKSDGWIQFDFGERKINLTSYTLRTSGNPSNDNYHAKTWRIVGSNDCNEWEVLNQQTNNPSLNGQYKQHRFECSSTDKYYRYIRYIQEDSWRASYEYCVYFTCIELFGSILLP